MMRHSSKLILSLGGFAALTPVECKSEKQKEKKGNSVRPSQLPLYENPEDLYSFEYIGKEKSKLEEGVAVARKELQSAYETTSDVRDNLEHYYQTGKAHTLTTWSYVMDEENASAKIGVISAGGLLGLLIFGRRKGIIKKLFYTSLGATGAASLLYPDESKKISQELYNNAGDYSLIAYNFIAGVKPQGENQTKSLPENQKPKNNAPKSEVSTIIGNVDSFESFARQASDVTVFGFRLFDWINKPTSGTSKTLPSPKENNKDIVVNIPKSEPSDSSSKTTPPIQGDIGQSNPEDKDMYTTRS